MDCSLSDSSVHGDSQGKNTGVGCHALLQGIFPTEGSNPPHLCLVHCRWLLYLLSHLGNPEEEIPSSKKQIQHPDLSKSNKRNQGSSKKRVILRQVRNTRGTWSIQKYQNVRKCSRGKKDRDMTNEHKRLNVEQ